MGRVAHCGAVPDFSVPGCKHDSRGMTEGRNPIHLCLFLAGGGRQGARGVLWGPIGVRISVVFADMVRFWFWFVSKCSLYKFYNNPAPVIRSMQFHYCTVSNPGTGADDAFVLKRCVLRNATWPSHSRPAIAAGARHFQICFLP